MTQMTPAEVRAIREGLGVTLQWLADHLGVGPRAVQRWEAGTSQIKPVHATALIALEAEAADQVASTVAALTDHGDAQLAPVMAIEEHSDTTWPPGWQRMIAFRVRQHVPTVRIVDIEPS